jgi:hypothetical protein
VLIDLLSSYENLHAEPAHMRVAPGKEQKQFLKQNISKTAAIFLI